MARPSKDWSIGANLAYTERVPTPQESYEATVAAVAGVVRNLEAQAGVPCRVGVGHHGALSPATGEA